MKVLRHISISLIVANVLLLFTPGRGFIMFLHLHGAALLHLWTTLFLALALTLVYRAKRKGRLRRVLLPVSASLTALVLSFGTLSMSAYFTGIPSGEELWSFLTKGLVVSGVLSSVCWLPVGVTSAILYARFCRAEEVPIQPAETTRGL